MVGTNPKGTTALLHCSRPAFRPFDKLRDRRLKDFPPQFVELVETNPEITSALAIHLRPFSSCLYFPFKNVPRET